MQTALPGTYFDRLGVPRLWPILLNSLNRRMRTRMSVVWEGSSDAPSLPPIPIKGTRSKEAGRGRTPWSEVARKS